MTDTLPPTTDVDPALTAFRDRIRRHAANEVRNGNLSATWANTQLRNLGIAPIDAANSYEITVHADVTFTVTQRGQTRAEALQAATDYVNGRPHRLGSRTNITNVTPATFEVTAGPDDTPPTTPTDVPTTLDATKTLYRDILLGAVIGTNGASLCVDGVRREFAKMGLGPFPTVTLYEVPVTGTATVRVGAFDSETAQRAAQAVLDRGEGVYTSTWADATVGVGTPTTDTDTGE